MKLSHAIHNTVFQESWCDTGAKIGRKTVLYSCSDNAVLLQAQALNSSGILKRNWEVSEKKKKPLKLI